MAAVLFYLYSYLFHNFIHQLWKWYTLLPNLINFLRARLIFLKLSPVIQGRFYIYYYHDGCTMHLIFAKLSVMLFDYGFPTFLLISFMNTVETLTSSVISINISFLYVGNACSPLYSIICLTCITRSQFVCRSNF